jgi:hypothetical protein
MKKGFFYNEICKKWKSISQTFWNSLTFLPLPSIFFLLFIENPGKFIPKINEKNCFNDYQEDKSNRSKQVIPHCETVKVSLS